MKFHILMPCYLHIPHTLDTARALTLSGRNCLVGEMCPQGTQKSHSGAAACLVAYLCVPTDDVDVDREYQLIPIDSL